MKKIPKISLGYLLQLEPGVSHTTCRAPQREKERERESSNAPINIGGPSRPRGFRHPSCPGDEEGERERERERESERASERASKHHARKL